MGVGVCDRCCRLDESSAGDVSDFVFVVVSDGWQCLAIDCSWLATGVDTSPNDLPHFRRLILQVILADLFELPVGTAIPDNKTNQGNNCNGKRKPEGK